MRRRCSTRSASPDDGLGLALGSTLVVRRRFDPEQTLDEHRAQQATALIVVPVMLQRMLDLGDDVVAARDLASLRIVFVERIAVRHRAAQAGAARRSAPSIYNLYGSTEVSYATIATPADLEAAPGMRRRRRARLDRQDLRRGRQRGAGGQTGRIFVGNASQFEGYTGGETKEQVAGLMSSGDVGHFDDEGRLFIDGRDDDMIVSGGENVFPGEVEELLAGHDAVEEVAAIGVDDEQFGQRLKAFVVLRDGQELSEDEVKDYVRDNLANYKTPREVVFVEELPRNPTGKVLKRELCERGDAESVDIAEAAAASGGRRLKRLTRH